MSDTVVCFAVDGEKRRKLASTVVQTIAERDLLWPFPKRQVPNLSWHSGGQSTLLVLRAVVASSGSYTEPCLASLCWSFKAYIR